MTEVEILVTVELHTTENLGDHGREIVIPIVLDSVRLFAVADLVDRAAGIHGKQTIMGQQNRLNEGDSLVIRWTYTR